MITLEEVLAKTGRVSYGDTWIAMSDPSAPLYNIYTTVGRNRGVLVMSTLDADSAWKHFCELVDIP